MNRRLAALVAALLPAALRAQTTSASGEVAKVDRAGGRITLKHNGIKNLDMPPMTMAFRLRDPKLLDGLEPGDRVRFSAERVEGQYTVTALGKAP